MSDLGLDRTRGTPPPVAGGTPGATPPPTTPPPSDGGVPSWATTLLNGRSPLGTSNFNINNGVSAYVSGGTNGQLDPRFGSYGRWQTTGSEATHPEFVPTNPRVNQQGYIDGTSVQIASDNGNIPYDRIIDPSLVTYDAEFGAITPLTNLRDPEQRGDQIFYALGAGMIAAPALAAAMGGTAGAAGGGGDIVGPPAADIPMDFTPMDPMAPPPTIPDLAAPPDFTGAPGAFNFDPLPPMDPPPTLPQLADTFTPGIDNAINTGGLPFDTSTTPPDVLNPTLQPPPTIDPVGTMPDIPGQPTWYDRAISRVTDDPMRAAGTALTVGQLLRGGSHTPTGPNGGRGVTDPDNTLAPGARNTLQNNGAPTQDQKGAIDAMIEEQMKNGREALLQASRNSGMGGKNSMVVGDKLRALGQQLETMRMQLYMKQAEQNVLNALNVLGLISREQFQLAQMELQQNNQAQQRAISIMQSLGWLWSAGSGQRQPQPQGGGQ